MQPARSPVTHRRTQRDITSTCFVADPAISLMLSLWITLGDEQKPAGGRPGRRGGRPW